jgi:hypothetical protein
MRSKTALSAWTLSKVELKLVLHPANTCSTTPASGLGLRLKFPSQTDELTLNALFATVVSSKLTLKKEG